MMGINIVARLLGLDAPRNEEVESEEPEEKVEKKVESYPTYEEMERRVGDRSGEE